MMTDTPYSGTEPNIQSATLPSAAELRQVSDDKLVDQIVESGQPGNSALAEMQRRTSERLVRAVRDFDNVSTRQANRMTYLTICIGVLALLQFLVLVFSL